MGSVSMSGQGDRNFASADDAKAELRAAMAYLLIGAAGTARDGIALEIMEILRHVAQGSLPDQPDPFADDSPGG